MKHFILIFIVSIGVAMASPAQELIKTVSFDYTTIKKVVVNSDFIYGAGYVETPGSSKLRDGFVVKLTQDGQIVWQKKIGGNLFDRINDMIVKGNYIYATGVTWTEDSHSQMWFVVLTTDGQIITQRDFGNTLNDGAYKIIPTGNGDFYLLGYATPQGINARNLWIIKVDAAGNLLWNEQLGALADNEEGLDAMLVGNRILVLARIWKMGVSDMDPWVFLMSGNGHIDWQTKNHIYEDNYFVKAMNYNNGFLLVGETWEKKKLKKGDIWLVGIDKQGKTFMDKTLGSSVVEDVEDAFLMNGNIWVFGGYNNKLKASIWQITPQGKISSQKVLDLPQIYSADELSNNELVIGGGNGREGYVSIVKL